MNLVLSLVFLLALSSCQQPTKSAPQTEAPPPAPDLQTSMHKFSEVLSSLLPKLYGDEATLSASDRQNLQSSVRALQDIAHDISDNAMPSQNPNLKIISTEFKSALTKVDTEMQKQNWSNAQKRLTHITRYCIACHTAGPGQSSKFALSLNPDLSGLTHFQKARYLTAVRRFDDAVAEFETALNDKTWSSSHPDEWDTGLVSILSIVTHVRKDTNLALEIISAFRDRKIFPPRMEPASSIWRKQARAWDRERKKSASLADVEEWIRFGQTLKRPDFANTFLFIRASARLNELLMEGSLTGQNELKALYLNGIVGTELKQFNYFSFPEQNFELCARRSPQSDLGKKCASELLKYKREAGV